MPVQSSAKKRTDASGYRAATWPPIVLSPDVRRGDVAATRAAWHTVTQEIVALERLAHEIQCGGAVEQAARSAARDGHGWAPDIARAIARILEHPREDLQISRLQQLAERRVQTHWLPLRVVAAAVLPRAAWQALWTEDGGRPLGFGASAGRVARNAEAVRWQERLETYARTAVWTDLIHDRLDVATVNAIYPDDHPVAVRGDGPVWVTAFVKYLTEEEDSDRRATGPTMQCAMRMLRARASGTPETQRAMSLLRAAWIRRLSLHAQWWPWVREFFAELTQEGARDPAWPWHDAELQIEAWMDQAEVPSPSPAYIDALLDRCQACADTSPNPQRTAVHAAILRAVLQRADLGWTIGRRVWARVTSPAVRWSFLQHGGLMAPGPWWQDVAFLTELLVTVRDLAAGIHRGEVALRQDLSVRVLIGMVGCAPADAWLETVLDLHAGGKAASAQRAYQLLAAMRMAGPTWTPSSEALLRALSDPDAEVRLWAQHMLAPTPQTAHPGPAAPAAGRGRH